MHRFFQADIALALEAAGYIAGVGVSQRLYGRYRGYLFVLILYPHRQGLPDKLFVYLELHYLHRHL
jgi:hypothetical protein